MKFAYVDTSVWINSVENIPEYNEIIEQHFKLLEKEGWLFCISEAVILELMYKPLKYNDTILQNQYIDLIKNTDKIQSQESIFSKALIVMHNETLKSMDSLHVAFAQEHGCKLFVTTDKHFKNLKTIRPYLIEFPVTTI